MKVLLVSNFFYPRGGDCTYLRSVQSMLERDGHEIAIFSTQHEGNWPLPAAGGILIPAIDYAAANHKKSLFSAVAVLRRSIWNAESARAMERLLSSWRPDIAHLQNIHAYLTPSILPILKKHHIPIVQTLHDYKWLCPDSTFLSNGTPCEKCHGRAFWHCLAGRCKKGSLAASAVTAAEGYVHRLRRVSSMVDLFIAPSHFIADKFMENGFPAHKIHVLLNPLPELSASSQSQPRPSVPYGLFVGSLAPIKGVDVFLRAAALIPSHPVHIVGPGASEDLARLKTLVADLGIASRVTFTGPLHGAELLRERASALYGVIPSICPETLGYTAMEMLATGKPVIAADIGGIPDLIQHEKTGLLVPPNDPDALAAAIRRLLADSGLAASLARAGREFVRSACSPAAYLPALLTRYRSLVTSAPNSDSRVVP